MHTNGYKGEGGGGSDHDKNTYFVHRFFENATISEPYHHDLKKD